MVTGFKIERNTFYQTPYYGLDTYVRNKGKLQHLITKPQAIAVLKDYSLFGRKIFAERMKFINNIKFELIDVTPIFQVPISDEQARQIIILDNELGKQFKKSKDLKKAIESYPLDNLLFAKVQIALGKKFKPFIVNNWVEKIVRNAE